MSGHAVELFETKTPGINFGLKIKFNGGMNVPKSQRIYLYNIGDKYDHPTYSEMKSFFHLLNHQTNIGMDKTVSMKLGQPYANCQVSSAMQNTHIYNQIKAANISYRQDTCLELCQEKHIAKSCNCTYYGFLRSSTKDYYPSRDCLLNNCH